MDFTFLHPDDARWQNLLGRIPHDVYHTPDYVRLLAKERGMEPCACYGNAGSSDLLLPLLVDELPAELSLSKDLRDARSPDGYPGPLFLGSESDLPAILSEFVAFLKSRRIISCFVRPHPLLGLRPSSFQDVAALVDHGPTASIDLNQTYDRILGAMRQGHRYEIRKAHDHGYSVFIDEWNLLPEFVNLYDALMDRVSAAPVYRFSHDYFEDFATKLDDEAHLAFAVNDRGEPAAGALFTERSGIIQYHLAASNPIFDKDAVQKVVVDGIIRWGLQQGADYLHLGGGVGARVDSLLQFKLGFGGKTLPYQTIRIVADPDTVAKATEKWEGIHGDAGTSNFFPSYRRTLDSND